MQQPRGDRNSTDLRKPSARKTMRNCLSTVNWPLVCACQILSGVLGNGINACRRFSFFFFFFSFSLPVAAQSWALHRNRTSVKLRPLENPRASVQDKSSRNKRLVLHFAAYSRQMRWQARITLKASRSTDCTGDWLMRPNNNRAGSALRQLPYSSSSCGPMH